MRHCRTKRLGLACPGSSCGHCYTKCILSQARFNTKKILKSTLSNKKDQIKAPHTLMRLLLVPSGVRYETEHLSLFSKIVDANPQSQFQKNSSQMNLSDRCNTSTFCFVCGSIAYIQVKRVRSKDEASSS